MMDDKKNKYKVGRAIFYLCYVSLGFLISVNFMNDSSGSAGPACIFFSWGSLLIYLLPYIYKTSNWAVILFVIALFTNGYLISLIIINGRQAKREIRFPLVTVAYHFMGAVIAYIFRFRFEEAAGLRFFLIVYAVLSTLIVIYIYFDWHLARKAFLLQRDNLKQYGK